MGVRRGRSARVWEEMAVAGEKGGEKCMYVLLIPGPYQGKDFAEGRGWRISNKASKLGTAEKGHEIEARDRETTRKGSGWAGIS